MLKRLVGVNLSVTVRNCLEKFGTPALWEMFSLKGKKGKLAFMDFLLHKVIMRKCFAEVVLLKFCKFMIIIYYAVLCV